MELGDVITFLEGPEFSEILRNAMQPIIEPIRQDIQKLKEDIKKLDMNVHVDVDVDMNNEEKNEKVVVQCEKMKKGKKRVSEMLVQLQPSGSEAESEDAEEVNSGQSEEKKEAKEKKKKEAKDKKNTIKRFKIQNGQLEEVESEDEV